jgi:hypothetical protein
LNTVSGIPIRKTAFTNPKATSHLGLIYTIRGYPSSVCLPGFFKQFLPINP